MKFKDLVKKIGEAVEVGKPETTKAYASVTPGQPDVVFTPPPEVDGVKIAAELDPAGGIEHNIKHALARKDKDEDGDVDAQDKHTPDEVTGDDKKNQTLHLLKKGAAERAHTKKGVAYEGYVATAPAPGDKWKDHAVMVNNTGKKQRVVILRKNIDNYPASDGWKEVRPGFKEEVELDEAMTPQQKSDFDRMMAGAMSRAAYNAKWKKPLKSDDKVIYGKNVKEESDIKVGDNVVWNKGKTAQTSGKVHKIETDHYIVHHTRTNTYHKLPKAGTQLAEDTEVMVEKLTASDDMGKWIDDFQKSDAPQFAGKSKEERRKMAIAAKMSADRDAGVMESTGPLSASDYMPGKRTGGANLPSGPHKKDTYVKTFAGNKEKEAHDFAKNRGYIVKKHTYPAGHTNAHPYEFQVHKEDVDNITESEEKTIGRLKQLVRFGLMDKSKLPLLSRAMSSLEKGNVANPTERQVLFDLLNELIGVVTGDDAMFAKVRMSVQNEGTDLEEQ